MRELSNKYYSKCCWKVIRHINATLSKCLVQVEQTTQKLGISLKTADKNLFNLLISFKFFETDDTFDDVTKLINQLDERMPC